MAEFIFKKRFSFLDYLGIIISLDIYDNHGILYGIIAMLILSVLVAALEEYFYYD